MTVTICTPAGDVETMTFRSSADGLAEEQVIRGMHPLTAQRLDLWRLKNFNGVRLPSAEDTYLIHVVAKDNPNDERLIAMAEVRDATPLMNAAGEVVGFPTVERLLTACIDSLRRARAQLGGARRLDHNRIFLYAWPSIELPLSQLATLARSIAPLTVGAGVDQIVLLGRLQEEPGVEPRDVALRFSNSPGTGVGLRVTDRPTEPMAPLDDYTQKVLRSRARGLAYPYELAPLVAGPRGTFVEHDLDGDGRLVPVDRPPGTNSAGVVVGTGDHADAALPRGHDPGRPVRGPDQGAGHRRRARVRPRRRRPRPGGGARPARGVVRAVLRRQDLDGQRHREHGRGRAGLRRIIEFTQAGGEINVVVAGINVGAQPYWNAEATMLMHTKGILVMTPDSAMVLTGKHSLDYSGGVSAEDNFGLGGYDRVMGPNGQAQYWAPNLSAAVRPAVRALRPRLRRAR